MEEHLRKFCFDAPHWMQIQMQGLWYGLISWRIQCVEDGEPVTKQTVQEYLEFAEPELVTWPYDWLQPTVDEFMSIEYSLEQLNKWFETLYTIFQDCIPADLNIFMILSTGESISEEQWKRLYDTVAFMPPTLQVTDTASKQAVVPVQQSVHKRRKTRRTHGRRAITPIKGRRAYTHHRSHVNTTVVKMQ
jgi:hypothetical protein